jgi:hypothetical protein
MLSPNPSEAMQPLLRAARAHRASVAAAGALLLVVGGAWALQAYEHVERTQDTAVSKAWSEQAGFTYSVPVQRDSPMFRNGTVLGMGEPAYVSSISPAFDVSFRWQVAQPAVSDAQALGSMVVEVRSDAQDGRALWTLEFPLANASSSAGQPLAMQGTVDLRDLEAQVHQGLQALDVGEAKLTWQVLARVAYTWHAPWGEVRNTSAFALPVRFDGPMYMLPTADEAQSGREHGDQLVTVHEQRAGLAGLLAAPIALGIAGLGGAGLGLAVLASRPPPGRRPEPQAEAVEKELAKFGMWVTEVEGPMEPSPEWGPVVDLNRLADLVDMAAEARTRVLLDASSKTFYVLTPQACYRFATHPWLHAAAEAGEPRRDPEGEPAEAAKGRRKLRWRRP